MYTIQANELAALALIAGKKDIRYYLNGVYFDPKGYAVATDGRSMLAIKLEHGKEANGVDALDPVSFVMDRAQVEQLCKIVPRAESIAVKLEGKKVMAHYIGGQCTYEAIDGKFPEWQRVMPRKFQSKGSHFNPELMARFSKVSKLLYGSIPTFHPSENDGAALVRNVGHRALGALMSIRQDAVTDAALSGEVSTFLASAA